MRLITTIELMPSTAAFIITFALPLLVSNPSHHELTTVNGAGDFSGLQGAHGWLRRRGCGRKRARFGAWHPWATSSFNVLHGLVHDGWSCGSS